MDLYIGNIPKGARPAELKKLIKECVREGIFTGLFDWMADMGRFDNGISVAFHNANTGRKNHYRYGHIRIDSENLAEVVVDNIEGANLRGEYIQAREMTSRTDERRISEKSSHYNRSDCRRVSERRRH